MTGSGGTDPKVVPGPDMAGRKQCDDRHPGGGAGRHPDRMVLDHQALRRVQAERLGHHDIDVRAGLAAGDSGRAEDPVAEMAAQPEPFERPVEPFAIARGGDGQEPARLLLEEGLYPLDRQDVGDPRRHQAVDASAKLREIDGEAAFRLDRPVAVAPAQPGIALDRLLGRDRVAQSGQRLGQGGVGDDLAVNDDPVEIEDDGLEPQGRSPNSAVPTRTWVAPIATAVS